MKSFCVIMLILTLSLASLTSGSPLCWRRFCGKRAEEHDQTNAEIITRQIVTLVQDTLSKAATGIQAKDLTKAVKEVKVLYDRLIINIADEDVKSLINEIAKKIGATPATSAIFEDQITYDANVLNDYLNIWDNLAQSANDKEATKQNVDIILAAISKVSSAIENIIQELNEMTSILKKTDSNGSVDINKEAIVTYEKQDGTENKETENRAMPQMQKRKWCIGICIGRK
ncbi:uncharacterized protein LOC129923333 [Biomphalaria glabrata]|uniref:Uncharacterized protein LOC129923333 n=1 Tax=Biomphalaria glabrata TaxID=6526 RepID=A0A9W2Z3Q7_BIOGL|nr:uncharacterized protein LOC129923333 [Biomphalaria glabrata]